MTTNEKVSYSDLYFNELKRYLDKVFNPGFLGKIPAASDKPDVQKRQLYAFLEKAVKNPDFRSSSELSYSFIAGGKLTQYIDAIFSSQAGIYKRIKKEDKFSFSKDDFINFFIISMLLKDIFYIKSDNKVFVFNSYHFSIEHFKNEIENYNQKALKMLRTEMPAISSLFFFILLKSALPYEKNDDSVLCVSRLISVFDRIAKMSRVFKKKNTAPPEADYESLFKILKTNATFLGLSIDIINEIESYSLNTGGNKE